MEREMTNMLSIRFLEGEGKGEKGKKRKRERRKE